MMKLKLFEEFSKKKILFLHGLDSQPWPDRIKIFSKYWDVVAPHLDYRKGDAKKAWEIAESEKFDAVTGHSMGGALGYFISTVLRVPCLIYNPGFGSDVTNKFLYTEPIRSINYDTMMVVGMADDVVLPEWQIGFAKKTFGDRTDEIVIRVSGLGHRISPDVFETYADMFAKKFPASH